MVILSAASDGRPKEVTSELGDEDVPDSDVEDSTEDVEKVQT